MENYYKFHGIPHENQVNVMQYITRSCTNCMFCHKNYIKNEFIGFSCGFTEEPIGSAGDYGNGLISDSCKFDEAISIHSFQSLGFKIISNNDEWYNFRNNKCDIFINMKDGYKKLVNIHSRGNSYVGNCKLTVNNPIDLATGLKLLKII